MCLICVELAKGKLTTKEARRALGEMAGGMDSAHLSEVKQKLSQAEEQQAAAREASDSEADADAEADRD
jgi:hypothetical protein